MKNKMRSKKAIIWGTLIGLVIASIVIVFVVVPILAAGYRILFPQPDYATLNGFDRLSSAIQNAELRVNYVPFQITRGFKVTTNENDKSCVKNCICLCKMTLGKGCLNRIYKETCSPNNIKMQGELWVPSVFLFEVSKSGDNVILEGDYSDDAVRLKNFQDCVGSGKFTSFPVTDRSCMACTDKLEIGRTDLGNMHEIEVGCGRYSYLDNTYETGAGTEGPYLEETEKAISLPKGSFDIDLAKAQCQQDPCNLAETKKIKCIWDDASGSCVSSTSLQSSSVPVLIQ